MMTNGEIRRKVKEAGVIGKGGAGFPAYAKLQAKAEVVLANGAECEPLLSNDKVLMERYAKEIVIGLRLAMQAVDAKKGIVCIKRKYKKADEAFKKVLTPDGKVEIFLLDDFYPAGDEVVMVKEVLGRTVPAGGLPLDIGVVVNNVGTLKKICKAVMKDENVTRKYVSVNGEVKSPKVVNVPIGMRIKEVLSLAGGAVVDDYAIITGGPNMGKVANTDDVIKKTTGALIVLPVDHPLVVRQRLNLRTIIKRAKAACLNCSFCSDMCPRNLVGHNIYPHKIMRAISLGLDSQTEALSGALLCSGCGVCENFACYMFLSPRRVCLEVKREFVSRGVKGSFSDKAVSMGKSAIERKIPKSRLKAKLRLTKYSDDLPLDEKFYTADKVKIMLCQHIGVVSMPVVKTGDMVRAGEKIADIPDGKLGAVYHSSIDGRVAEIMDDNILIISGKGTK